METLTKEQFDEQLDILWEQRSEKQYHKQYQELLTLIVHAKEEMDSISYLKIMYLMGKYYEEQGNSNGSRYCAMRMFMILDCFKHKFRKRSRFLKFQVMELEDDMKEFLDERLNFLSETYRFIQMRLFWLLSIVNIIVFICAWSFKVSLWLNIVMVLLLFGFCYYLFVKRLKDRFHDRQTKALIPYIDEELKEFDRPILYG